MVPTNLLDILRCPRHPGAESLTPAGGALRCPECGNEYPVRDGIPVMIDPARAADEFLAAEGRQWDALAEEYETTRGADPRYLAGVGAAVHTVGAEPGEHVLDAGCGTGLTTRRLVRAGCRVTALDASHASLRFLRERAGEAGLRTVQGDLAALPFPDGAFDRVLCANALQQVPGAEARRRCVRELTRVTRPGGRVVVTVQQHSWPRRRAGWVKEGPTGHGVRYIYRFARAEFADLLRAALEAVRVTGAGFPLPYRLKLSAAARLFERIGWELPVAAGLADLLVGVGTRPALPVAPGGLAEDPATHSAESQAT